MSIPAADEQEIRQLLARYAHVVDDHDLDSLGLVFAPDCHVVVGLEPPIVIDGLDAIREFVRHLDSPDHHTVDILLDPAGPDAVRARSRYVTVGKDGTVTNGTYDDRLVRTGDGWRIADRRTRVRNMPA